MPSRKERHNGHHEEWTRAQRVRSGFDRRKNWGDAIENVYRRIDHRLSELVKESPAAPQDVERQAGRLARRYPITLVAAGAGVGLLLGLLWHRRKS